MQSSTLTTNKQPEFTINNKQAATKRQSSQFTRNKQEEITISNKLKGGVHH